MATAHTESHVTKKIKRTQNKNNNTIIHIKLHEHLAFINYRVISLLSLVHPTSKAHLPPNLKPTSQHFGGGGQLNTFPVHHA